MVRISVGTNTLPSPCCPPPGSQRYLLPRKPLSVPQEVGEELQLPRELLQVARLELLLQDKGDGGVRLSTLVPPPQGTAPSRCGVANADATHGMAREDLGTGMVTQPHSTGTHSQSRGCSRPSLGSCGNP